VAQFLIDRFKFKLISAFDLVRFEEKTGSPEGAEVKKCIEQKQ
jgi:adenylate kinase family enzyme